jgi:hypothetical protein
VRLSLRGKRRSKHSLRYNNACRLIKCFVGIGSSLTIGTNCVVHFMIQFTGAMRAA